MSDAPVKVGWAPNEPQAQLLQSLLRDYGIPSVATRQLGFDLPDYLSAGARDIRVAPADADDARAILAPAPLDVEAGDPVEPAGRPRRPLWVRVLAVLLLLSLGAGGSWSAASLGD